jgi:CheY-like chemotaxis protein
VRVRNRLESGLWPALVDPTQVELVILNLAINARDAMPGGGELIIETRNVRLPPSPQADALPAGDYVEIRVSDTGVGMTADVQAKAFEPFFTTKQVGSGSGLGLSQVFGTARQSGGDVSIESRPGQGSTVILHLPRAPAPMVDAPAAPSPASRAKAEPRLVLLVDDEAAVRETTAELLRTLGYAVIEAGGGPAALECLRMDKNIALLLTDVVMPDMNGPALAEAARALRPGLPVVFISGYADFAGVADGAALGPMVRKPYRPSELTDQMAAALSAVPAEA